MSIGLQIEVNVIAASILIILIQNSRRTGKNMLDDRLYLLLIYASFLYLAADTISWLLNGTHDDNMRFALYAVNILCYLMCVIVPYLWLLYAECHLLEDETKLWKLNRLFAPPLFLYALLVIATPLTGWMFSFDDQQMYQRGPLFFLHIFLTLFYMLLPTVRALLRLRKTTVLSERQECINIAGFMVLPFIGLIVQVIFYGISAAIVATVISELMIFINVQTKQISLDALTGVNNRGRLNRYLNVQSKKEAREGKLYLLLMDIDKFKLINDTFGHKAGDLALIDMATILQNACDRHGGFLSRYGGDEFAIVIEKPSSKEIDLLNDNILQSVRDFNGSGKREYKLSVSIGYAQYGTATTQNLDQLIEQADKQMYLCKKRRSNDQPAPATTVPVLT